MIFAKNEKLVELENESKWKEAVELLRDQWYKDRHNNNSLLRLATECWYLLSIWIKVVSCIYSLKNREKKC